MQARSDWALALIATLAALFVARPAFGAAPPPSPKATITVTADKSLTFTATLTFNPKTDKPTQCQVGTGAATLKKGVDSSKGTQTLATARAGDTSVDAKFISALFDSQTVTCSGNGVTLDPITPTLPTPTSDLTPATTVGLVYYPAFIVPLFNETWAKPLRLTLGAPATCTAKGAAAAAGSCQVVDQQDGGLNLQIDSAPTTGTVAVVFSSKTTLQFTVQACEFDATGPVRGLVAGAVDQWVTLGPVQAACGLGLNRAVALQYQTTSVPLQLQPAEPSALPAGSRLAFRIAGVDPSLALGQRDFNVMTPSGAIGIAHIEVLAPLKAEATIKVDYQMSARQDVLGDFGQASGQDSDGIAVVDPLASSRPKEAFIVNTVTVTVPNGIPGVGSRWPKDLPALTSGCSASSGPAGATFQTMADVFAKNPLSLQPGTYVTKPATYVWTIADSNLPGGLQVEGCDDQANQDASSSGRQAVTPPCILRGGLGQVTFRVGRPTSQPISVSVVLNRLVTRSATFSQGLGSVEYECNEVQRVLEAPVTLASSARQESVPMPIKALVHVECNGEKWKSPDALVTGCNSGPGSPRCFADGGTYAIEDSAVRDGLCKLVVSTPSVRETKVLGGTLSGGELAQLYGPQALVVEVDRDGVDKAQQIWQIWIPKSLGAFGVEPRQELPLPVPSADEKGNGVYRVSLQVAAAPSSQVAYRHATDDPRLNSISGRQYSETQFGVQLRPRGLFGWKSLPIRTYVTVPVSVFGMRFPAIPSDIHPGAVTDQYQQLPIGTVGTLFSLEYFDYDKGVDPLPLNPTFQTGLNMFQLDGSGAGLALSYVTGVAMTWPILGSSNTPAHLGTTLAVGVFWENDLRQPFPYANHALLTLGVNVLSLFSGNHQ